VPIKEERLRKITFDLCKQKRSIALIFDDFSGQSFDVKLLQPLLDMMCCLI